MLDLVEGLPVPDSSATAGYRIVEFTSDGAVLRGHLYLPDREPAPVVVMADGFSSSRLPIGAAGS